jgi:membrane-associated phospholipid phosphatase
LSVSFPADALVIVQAAILAGDVNQLVKFAFRRERPFVHALPDASARANTADPADNNLSFFSGHTTLAFTLATAVGTVATMRGYKFAPFTWPILLPIAAFTGYLRIAADKHYATDVLTGAVVGSAMGLAIPWVFHRPESAPVDSSRAAFAVTPSARGTTITASFVW